MRCIMGRCEFSDFEPYIVGMHASFVGNAPYGIWNEEALGLRKWTFCVLHLQLSCNFTIALKLENTLKV